MLKRLSVFFALLMSIMSPPLVAATETLPVKAFASLPDTSQMRLSPNGMKVASLRRLETEERKGTIIEILDLETDKRTYPIYADNKKYEINWIAWANNKQMLVSAEFPAVRFGVPTTETRLLILDTHTKKTRNAIPKRYYDRFNYMPQIQDQIVDMLPKDDQHFLLQVDGYTPGDDTVYKVALNKSKIRMVQSSKPKIRSWMTDRQHNVRIGHHWEDTDYKIIHRFPGTKKWQTLWEFESFADNQAWPLGFAQNPDHLYVKALYKGKYAVFLVNLRDTNLEKKLIHHNEHYDIDGRLIYSQVEQKVVGITEPSNSGYTFWDEKYKAIQRSVSQGLPDTDNYITSMSQDERRFIILATNSTDPGMYLLADRDKNTMTPIGLRYSALDPKSMAVKQAISYKARDGLEIEGFLTLPHGQETHTKLPTIIFPHGGPISHNGNGFDYWTQFFANRGYAVLQMNFRGSSGYGHDFMKAGLKSWGLAMQDDVEDGTRWMIEQGYADPEKICIVGGSYGGYAALMGAVKTPDLYKCVVSFAGITDLARLVRSRQNYLSGEIVKEQIGSKRSDLKTRSPVNHAETISAPVLLIHGDKDRRVSVVQSRKMRNALQKARKDITYIELKDGSHYLSINKNRIATFEAMDNFLAEHLSN